MQITWMPINQIQPYDKNPRKNHRTVEKLIQSLKEYGWQQPIVVDIQNVIIVGHARWQAAVKLGMVEVPVSCAADLTETQVRSYRLADNRLSEESSWDAKFLSEELAALHELNIDLSLTGFRETEINHLIGAVGEIIVDPDNLLPMQSQAVTQPGDVWLLGYHRLMCGDASNEEHVATLMDGQKANLIFTDPPYNVNYQGGVKDRQKKTRNRALYNDDLPLEVYLSMLQAALTHAATYSEPEASLYLCHADHHIAALKSVLTAADFDVRSVLIWAKQHFVLNYARYKTQHEPILYCHRRGQTDVWYGDNKQSTLWCFDKPTKSDLHPTMKPVGLI